MVETKFSANGWDRDRFTGERIKRAVDQVTKNQKDVTGIMRNAVPSGLVQPVVVLWGGSTESDPVIEEDGVAICPAPSPRLARVHRDNGLDDEATMAAWRKVKEHIARRDKADLKSQGPPPRGMMSRVFLIAGVTLVGMTGFLAEVAVLRTTGAAWFPAVGAGLAVLLGSLTDRTRPSLDPRMASRYAVRDGSLTPLPTWLLLLHGIFTDDGRRATDRVDDGVSVSVDASD